MPALANDQGGFIMGVNLGFLVTLEAKDGMGEELGEFLRSGREWTRRASRWSPTRSRTRGNCT
jgi:hypothetical protein